MEEDLNLELDQVENNVEERLKTKNRFEKLSETAILQTKAREEAEAKVKTEAEARVNAEKERDFYKDFSQNASKYPNANEYQDQIFEKVKAGYSTEDAMVAVLAKEGKYQSPSQPAYQPVVQAEGGSAPTSFEGNKSLENMTPDEKFSALQELEKSGALSDVLRGGR